MWRRLARRLLPHPVFQALDGNRHATPRQVRLLPQALQPAVDGVREALHGHIAEVERQAPGEPG